MEIKNKERYSTRQSSEAHPAQFCNKFNIAVESSVDNLDPLRHEKRAKKLKRVSQ